MNIIFMGTPTFALPSLRLLAEKYSLIAAVTQPDKKAGRKGVMMPPPVKTWALENNILVLQPEKVRDENFILRLKQLQPDMIVVAAYGQILPEEILNMPKYGCLNVHGSLLPKLRGAAPIQYAIVNGETVTGVTIMYMDKGLDTGDMLLKKEIEILDTDDFQTLHDKMAVLGAEALEEVVKDIGNFQRIKQNDEEATYAPMLTKKSGLIDWHKRSIEIINLIRGLNPWPGAYTYYGQETLKIFKAEMTDGFTARHPGEIVKTTKEGFIIKTGDGALLITELQGQGGKKMDAASFMRGRKIEVGKHM